jgi:hypothetical protein
MRNYIFSTSEGSAVVKAENARYKEFYLDVVALTQHAQSLFLSCRSENERTKLRKH